MEAVSGGRHIFYLHLPDNFLEAAKYSCILFFWRPPYHVLRLEVMVGLEFRFGLGLRWVRNRVGLGLVRFRMGLGFGLRYI
jgi:hypothetical protein